MTLPRSAADVLAGHVTSRSSASTGCISTCISPGCSMWKGWCSSCVPSWLSDRVAPRCWSRSAEAFIADIYRFAADRHVPVVDFAKGQRKDDLAQEYLAEFDGPRGCCSSAGPRRRRRCSAPRSAATPSRAPTYPWIVKTTAMVNHFYIYAVDADFGPFFIKFCTYFPYNAKLCINGNEWAKRQAAKAGIGFEALDNGFAACEDPARLQAHLRPSQPGPGSTGCCASG